jgi:putative tryptophan/tyrosine transport system substrate-binding protein
MRRRDFIKWVAGSATAWPFATHAQQAAGMRRVAILSAAAETDPETQRWFAAFLQELRGLGWIEGSNMRIDAHWATADVGRVNRAAIEVIDRKPDVILAVGPLSVAGIHIGRIRSERQAARGA